MSPRRRVEPDRPELFRLPEPGRAVARFRWSPGSPPSPSSLR